MIPQGPYVERCKQHCMGRQWYLYAVFIQSYIELMQWARPACTVITMATDAHPLDVRRDPCISMTSINNNIMDMMTEK